jgi:hypothetical protein
VPADQPGVRVFVVHSDQRLTDERAQRLRAMDRVRTQLVALERRVTTGKLKAPANIRAAAARILTRSHGFRYYDWEYRAGRFRFFEHPVNLPREEAYEGNAPAVTVGIYKQLSEVERAFANLKDVIELRPIYHQADPRAEARIFVAALAFLLHRAIEKKLKAAGLDVSSTEALPVLRTVRVVDFVLGDGRTKRSVTRGSSRAAQVLSALGITDLTPPTPPTETATVM